MTPFRRASDFAGMPGRPDVATADFDATQGGLFSSDDVRRLMRIEFERAQRYHYPLACFLIAVDRLDRLNDLYGMETRDTILTSLAELVRTETRASDLLGVMVDDRLLVLVPHTARAGADALARRLLDGAKRLKFESDGRTVRVTLSVGGSHNQSAKPTQRLFYETLLAVAESGLDVALQAGGDRFVHTELYDWFQRRAERTLPSGIESPTPSPGALLGQDGPGTPKAVYVDGMRILAGIGSDSRPPEARTAAEAEAQADLASREQRELDYQRQIDNLERRISKLNDMLAKTEEDLARMAATKDIDTGVASVYRNVQGVSALDEAKALKKDLMQKIFEANLELKNAVTKHSPPA